MQEKIKNFLVRIYRSILRNKLPKEKNVGVSVSSFSKLEDKSSTNPHVIPFNIENQSDYSTKINCDSDIYIRDFPSPFDHALSFFSDCDNAKKETVLQYTGCLRRRYGLEFGDSFFFLQDTLESRTISYNTVLDQIGLNNSELDCDKLPATPVNKAIEFVDEGCWDHLHGLAENCPRIVWIDLESSEKNCNEPDRISHEIKISESVSTRYSQLRASSIVVVVKGVQETIDLELRVKLNSNVSFDKLVRCSRDDMSDRTQKNNGSTLARGVMTFESPYSINDIDTCIISFSADSALVKCSGFGFLFGSRDFILNRISEWKRNRGPDIHLLTDHAAFGFLSNASEQNHLKQGNDKFSNELATGRYARSVTPSGIELNLLPDSPTSYSYCLDHLKEKIGLRFMNPSGYSGEFTSGFKLKNALHSTTARDETGIYLIRRAMPVIEDRQTATDKFPHLSRLPNVAKRIDIFLRSLNNETDAMVCPLYTHLGIIKGYNISPRRAMTEQGFRHLFDHYYGFNTGKRVLVLRASTLCNYLLHHRNLPKNIKQTEDGNIEIAPYFDDTLRKTVPEFSGELFGITLSLTSPERRKYYLAEREINNICFYGRKINDTVEINEATILGDGLEYQIQIDHKHSSGEKLSVELEKFRPTSSMYIGFEFRDPADISTFKFSYVSLGVKYSFVPHGRKKDNDTDAVLTYPFQKFTDCRLIWLPLFDFSYRRSFKKRRPPNGYVSSLEWSGVGECAEMLSKVRFFRPSATHTRILKSVDVQPVIA